MFDLENYLRRIGLEGRPGIADVHRAQVFTIPFENLDPRRGVPVSLELDDIVAKLVDGGRGGYCFEHNLLLAAAYEALGYPVELVAARARFAAPRGTARPPLHVLLRVQAEGETWHADAGFGGAGTLLEPIPWGPGGAHSQDGWAFQVVEEGDQLVLRTRRGEGWADVYSFRQTPVPRVDLEPANWFTSTCPRTPFASGIIVSVTRPGGRRVLLSDWRGELTLTESSPGAEAHRPVGAGEFGPLLAARFGLPGWTLAETGELELA
ncbi:MAG: arylamine N-acetyltransferase [Microbacterium sp.]|uniref:arylamine N-acetyltransferase family protein n=1 Tax=Microbacterium sp. TaxID=51671 RepID=UPI0039E3BDFA